MRADDSGSRPSVPGVSERRPRRDSLYGENIGRVWRTRPVPPPVGMRIASAMLGALSAVTTCFAIAVGQTFKVPIGGILFVAAWLACLALAAYFGPGIWRREIQIVLTSKHVIWRRGRLRRSIERRAVSYARIHWHPKVAGVGDLELVRAVPTGALRRTLSITLPDLEAPDAVWAEIRGVVTTPVLGDGARPLGQRLDPAERVLWTAQPASHRRWDMQRIGTLAIALVALLSGVRALLGGVHALKVLHDAGLRTISASFGALALSVGISVAAVLVTSLIAGYHALFRPRALDHATRYVVTDRRVLIQRGSQELHLDRDRIVDVIDAPDRGFHDLFLVLGGKNAHAHALAGAFGERVVGGMTGQLLPVLRGLQDSETVRAILTEEREAA